MKAIATTLDRIGHKVDNAVGDALKVLIDVYLTGDRNQWASTTGDIGVRTMARAPLRQECLAVRIRHSSALRYPTGPRSHFPLSPSLSNLISRTIINASLDNLPRAVQTRGRRIHYACAG
jgi:hypothetical protein